MARGGGTLTVLTVRHTAASAGPVRHWLLAELARRGLPAPLRADAALLASELVANAVRHARALPGGVLRVGWELTGQWLVIWVTDGGGWDTPRLRPAGPRETRGRGLALVDAIALDWGVEPDGATGATAVWAALLAGRQGRRGRGGSPAESGLVGT